MNTEDIVIRDFDAACYNNGDLYRDVRNLYNRFVEDYYAFIEYNGIKDGEEFAHDYGESNEVMTEFNTELGIGEYIEQEQKKAQEKAKKEQEKEEQKKAKAIAKKKEEESKKGYETLSLFDWGD